MIYLYGIINYPLKRKIKFFNRLKDGETEKKMKKAKIIIKGNEISAKVKNHSYYCEINNNKINAVNGIIELIKENYTVNNFKIIEK